MLLFCEVDMRGHAGQFDQTAQGDLAPLPAHIGAAQSGDQVARFARQGALAARQNLDLRTDGRE